MCIYLVLCIQWYLEIYQYPYQIFWARRCIYLWWILNIGRWIFNSLMYLSILWWQWNFGRPRQVDLGPGWEDGELNQLGDGFWKKKCINHTWYITRLISCVDLLEVNLWSISRLVYQRSCVVQEKESWQINITVPSNVFYSQASLFCIEIVWMRGKGSAAMAL